MCRTWLERRVVAGGLLAVVNVEAGVAELRAEAAGAVVGAQLRQRQRASGSRRAPARLFHMGFRL